MQIVEITLHNNNNSVFAKNPKNYADKSWVVVNINGSPEMGIIKQAINSTPAELYEIIRIANEKDKKQFCENCRHCKTLVADIKKEAEKLKLDMKISFVSTSLDKSKYLISYTADDRVDFRELVKILGNKLKAKIEMRQIGNRDETKVLGALGVCGRVTCCKAYLNDFDKVSIKMAKNQNISINPQRINGMCGRLLCCLKYEDDFYAEMQKKMPKINSTVTTPDGKGVVSNLDFLKEQVGVTFTKDDTTEIKVYDLSEINKNTKEVK